MHLTLARPLAALGLAGLLLLQVPPTWAHAGAVDANGCHKEGASGKRHCHQERAKQGKQPRFSAARPPRAGDEGVFFGPLISVTDGDTLRVKVQGVAMDFRLAQIDAPEKNQPYGSEARNELLQLARGQQLVLVPIDTDRYGRIVADAWVGSRCLNRELVKSGSAWFYDEFSNDDALYQLEQQARTAKKGLWALPAAKRIEPWRWRHEKR
jgi:endonuclease YncB( thermonuclease family)